MLGRRDTHPIAQPGASNARSGHGGPQAATLENGVTAYLTTEKGAAFAVVGRLFEFLFWRVG